MKKFWAIFESAKKEGVTEPSGVIGRNSKIRGCSVHLLDIHCMVAPA